MPVFPIGAIVAAASKRSEEVHYTEIDPTKTLSSIEYKIIFKKRFKFPEMRALGGLIETIDDKLDIITVDSMVYGVTQVFNISSDEFKGNIIKYIENNMDKFTAADLWATLDQEVINAYLSELSLMYCVFLKPDQVSYDVEFSYEIVLQ